ncbi:hypothetical protein AAVH_14191 [Aphelenchoides avenae]|nr:hypothetical protein AAVH_14191 [Aphelenchus avenae]
MSVSKSLLPIILIAVSYVASEKVEECTCSQVKACRQQAREQLFERCLTQCKFLLSQNGSPRRSIKCLLAEAHGCFSAVHSDLCASRKGHMIEGRSMIPHQQFMKPFENDDQDPQANRFFACVNRCATDRIVDGTAAHACLALLQCGVRSPNDKTAIAREKQCRMSVCKCWKAGNMNDLCNVKKYQHYYKGHKPHPCFECH